MIKKFKVLNILFVGLIALFSFIGCDDKVSFGPKEIHWDRDMCERCKMVLSDRHFSAQVVNPDNGKKYVFDDLGCAILWLKNEKVAWADKALIWVNDAKTGQWIDAKSAFYDAVSLTPMSYGFGAHFSKDDISHPNAVLSYEEVQRRVISIGK